MKFRSLRWAVQTKIIWLNRKKYKARGKIAISVKEQFDIYTWKQIKFRKNHASLDKVCFFFFFSLIPSLFSFLNFLFHKLKVCSLLKKCQLISLVQNFHRMQQLRSTEPYWKLSSLNLSSCWHTCALPSLHNKTKWLKAHSIL